MKIGMKKLLAALTMSAVTLTSVSCTININPPEVTEEHDGDGTDITDVTDETEEPAETDGDESGSAGAAVSEAQNVTEAETQTSAVGEPATAESGDSVHPFKLGVWLVSGGNEEDEYYDEAYYCFSEDGEGSILSQSMGIGVPFMYEMNADDPLKGVFHMAAVDSNSYIEIVEQGTEAVKVKWKGSDTTETWTYLCPQDEFSFYSSYDLGTMAKKLFGMSLYAPADLEFDYSLENGLVSIILFDPTEEDSTKSIQKQYYIDRYTAKGTDDEGNGVDLTVLEDGWDDMPYPIRFEGTPDLDQRHQLIDEGSMLGFCYIGYIEPWLNDIDEYRDQYNYLFERTGILKNFRLLKNFPSDRFVTTGDGQELYFILPADEHGSITVTKLEFDGDTGELTEGDVLYSSEGISYPILLQCNSSEIYSDVVIKLTDRSGNYVEWSPIVSGNDGTVSTANDYGVSIHDFTDYDRLIVPDMMPGVG